MRRDRPPGGGGGVGRSLRGLVFLAACTTDVRPGLHDAHRDLTDALPVLPGAEGFGTDTPAGRGGAVLRVTTLSADGPGSLAVALRTPGPRTVVFEVSGTIWTTEDLLLTEPFATVAGQTAPAPGVTLAGAGLRIEASDVLVQHLRFRVGDRPEGPDGEFRRGVMVANRDGRVQRVVIDHCSISWATDDNSGTWHDVDDVTYAHNLIAEGLYASLHPEGEHSKGLLIGDGARRISVIRNAFVHNADRNPVMGADTSSLVVNNLVYDPGKLAIVHYGRRGCCPSIASIVSNRVVPGPSTPEGNPHVIITGKTSRDTRLYVEDSGPREAERTDKQWADEPPVTLVPLTVVGSDAVEALLVGHVGARAADRDAVDRRLIEEIAVRGGGPVDSPSQVGGWPELEERVVALELPEDPGGDADGDGYTNLEHWLHERAAEVEGR